MNRFKLKEHIEISTNEIIQFLKQEYIYIDDNKLEAKVSNVKALNNADENSLCFISSLKYDLDLLKANLFLVPEKFKGNSNSKSIIKVKNTRLAIILIIKKFFIENIKKEYIDKSAIIDDTSNVGQYCIIGKNVTIGENCSIGNNVFISNNVSILSNTKIGNDVFIDAGSVIGAEGVGHIRGLNEELIQFPHISGVIIGDYVEIGANSIIAKGVLDNTKIGNGTKIGPGCSVGHNVNIGRRCILAGNNLIAGSSILGEDCWIGVSATISDGLKIGDNVTISIGSVVMSNIENNKKVTGYLAQEHDKFLINYLRLFNG